MLTSYLNQRAQCQIMQKTNGKPVLNIHGEASYHPAIELAVRVEDRVQEIQNARGELAKSVREYYTVQPLEVGDKLDGKEIIAVVTYHGYAGRVIGYRVYV